MEKYTCEFYLLSDVFENCTNLRVEFWDSAFLDFTSGDCNRSLITADRIYSVLKHMGDPDEMRCYSGTFRDRLLSEIEIAKQRLNVIGVNAYVDVEN